MPVRFFNAGDRISEAMLFTLPDGHDIHCQARWMLDAPAAEFFTVPTEMQIGSARVMVRFADDIERKFGHRGVIRIDKNLDAQQINEDQAVATNEAEARKKGEARWRDYLKKVVQTYLDEADQARSAGGAPRRPGGFTRRAMQLLGVSDPSERVFEAAAPESKVAKLERELEEMKQLLMARGAQLPLEENGKGARR